MGKAGPVKNLIRVVVVIVLILAGFAFWQDNRLNFGGKTVVAKTRVKDTDRFAVILEAPDKDNHPQYFLSVDRPKAPQVLLSGFEDNIEFCSSSVDANVTDENLLCLWGDVGVHSKNLQLFSYKSGEITEIPFAIDVEEAGNLTSDVPDYRLTKNNAGAIKLEAYNRDYDGNPLTDSIVSSYTLTNGRFVFDKEARITYDNNR